MRLWPGSAGYQPPINWALGLVLAVGAWAVRPVHRGILPNNLSTYPISTPSADTDTLATPKRSRDHCSRGSARRGGKVSD